MSKFKIGDKVRCIEEWNGSEKDFYRLFINRSYRITAVGSFDLEVKIKGHQNSEMSWWDTRRFEKVSSNKRKKQ